MKYIIILWYFATPPLGISETGSTFAEMPSVYGAAIEPLNYEKVIVILGRFDSKSRCREKADVRVAMHLSNIAKTRDVKTVAFGCFQDPKP